MSTGLHITTTKVKQIDKQNTKRINMFLFIFNILSSTGVILNTAMSAFHVSWPDKKLAYIIFNIILIVFYLINLYLLSFTNLTAHSNIRVGKKGWLIFWTWVAKVTYFLIVFSSIFNIITDCSSAFNPDSEFVKNINMLIPFTQVSCLVISALVITYIKYLIARKSSIPGNEKNK